MADISHEDLKNEIHAILKTADLNVMSAKKIREQAEQQLGCSLISRKKECDDIVMAYMNAREAEDDNNEEEEITKSAGEEEHSEENESESEEVDSEEDRKMTRKRKAAKTKGAPATKKKAASGGGGAKRSTGFTRALTLSPDLAALVGAESMSRHEVVKRVWGIIKERQLADPKNKQFTICDDQLYKVMKVKRFRTFGMLKHLKPHFMD